jgi:hypothetical protein
MAHEVKEVDAHVGSPTQANWGDFDILLTDVINNSEYLKNLGVNAALVIEEFHKSIFAPNRFRATNVSNDSNLKGATVKEALNSAAVATGIIHGSNVPIDKNATVADALNWLYAKSPKAGE